MRYSYRFWPFIAPFYEYNHPSSFHHSFSTLPSTHSRPLPPSQMRRAQRDLQNYHKKKHEIVEQAKKQEREAIRDRERAALDIRHMSTSGSYQGAANGGTGEPRSDLGRRTPSSGSFFARVAAGGPGGGAAAAPGNGPTPGGGVRGAGASSSTAINRKFEGGLTDFFML